MSSGNASQIENIWVNCSD